LIGCASGKSTIVDFSEQIRENKFALAGGQSDLAKYCQTI